MRVHFNAQDIRDMVKDSVKEDFPSKEIIVSLSTSDKGKGFEAYAEIKKIKQNEKTLFDEQVSDNENEKDS